jgi:hypothetical protein
MQELPKLSPSDPDVPATYSIDFSDRLELRIELSRTYVVTTVVKAPRDTGFYYECTRAGKTGFTFPLRWPTKPGEVVAVGSAEFTCRRPSEVVTNTIQSATWTLDAGLTLDSQSETDAEAFITVSGGENDTVYRATCLMIPTSGDSIEQTVLIPRINQ